jgi:glycosyltransferase involved in cell wall biosynthesis
MDSNPLRIAFYQKILPSTQPGGVANQVHWLANALCRRGHHVCCFTLSYRPADALYEVQSEPDQQPRSAVAKKFSAAHYFRSVSPKGFDIHHYHGDDYLIPRRVNHIRTFYGSALHEAMFAGSVGRLGYQLLFYLFEWYSLLRANTTAAISYATCTALPLVKKVIYCGIPLDRFSTTFNIERSPYPSILFLGDLNSRKRGALLIHHFTSYIRNKLPQAQLTVIGPQPVKGEGIHWIPRCSESELIQHYQRHWILCNPSSYEGFGVPLIEAMACGCAVVATPHAGAKEIIRNGINGLLVQPDSIGKEIYSLLTNTHVRKGIIEQGFCTARLFDITITAQLYEKVYYSCLHRC